MSDQPKRGYQLHKRKAIKPTNEELEKRIDDAAFLVARGATRTQIHTALCKRYSIDWRTVDRYVSRARENWAKRIGKSKTDHIGDVFATLENIILTSKDNNEIMRATKQKRELLALDAPKRIEVTGADGRPIEIDATHSIRKLPQATIVEIAKLLDAADSENVAS